MKDKEDNNMTETALRELSEEMGIDSVDVNILGLLRCDWSELSSIVGVGVTPVIGYIGKLKELKLKINPDEVSFSFTQTLEDLCNASKWSLRDYSSPVYANDGHVIWGLTG